MWQRYRDTLHHYIYIIIIIIIIIKIVIEVHNNDNWCWENFTINNDALMIPALSSTWWWSKTPILILGYHRSVNQSKGGEDLGNGGSFPRELQNTNTNTNIIQRYMCTHRQNTNMEDIFIEKCKLKTFQTIFVMFLINHQLWILIIWNDQHLGVYDILSYTSNGKNYMIIKYNQYSHLIIYQKYCEKVWKVCSNLPKKLTYF